VVAESDLARQPLAALFKDGTADESRITALLAVMKRRTRPVKPRDLGVIGSDHLLEICKAAGAVAETFRYRLIAAETPDGIPYVVEAAFAAAKDKSRGLVLGVNFAAALGNPFRTFAKYSEYDGLETRLAERRCGRSEPVVVILHLACARVEYQDRGKTAVVLSPAIAEAINAAIDSVTSVWAKQRKAEERNRAAETKRWLRLTAQSKREEAKRKQEEAREEKELHAEERQQRQRAATVGTGALYREIAAAANGEGLNALTVLSPKNDPYRLDTTEGHANGKWFADQVARFVPDGGQIHLRGLHYRIVAAAGVNRSDDTPYVNDEVCWRWLQNKAAKAARWLGYVPFDRIRDERNERPTVILPHLEAEARCSFGDFAELPKPPGAPFVISSQLPKVVLPDVDALLPNVELSSFERRQPYRIILFGEKSSLTPVLAPLAARFNTELILPTGETSDTLVFEMVQRAAADGRSAVVLYFSDFDPSGWQMPVSVSRKLQALKLLHFPTLDVQVHRVALTIEQVREHNLPASPLKKTEKRAARWKEHWGHEQTEIDALAALRPDILQNIAMTVISLFYDRDLSRRVEDARDQYLAEANRRLREHPGYERLRLAIQETDRLTVNAISGAQKDLSTAIEAVLAQMRPELDRVREQQSQTLQELRGRYDLIRQELSAISLPEIDIPEPEIDEGGQPEPLFTTADDFITATRRLIASKALEDDDDC
jgi:hypothetical protein